MFLRPINRTNLLGESTWYLRRRHRQHLRQYYAIKSVQPSTQLCEPFRKSPQKYSERRHLMDRHTAKNSIRSRYMDYGVNTPLWLLRFQFQRKNLPRTRQKMAGEGCHNLPPLGSYMVETSYVALSCKRTGILFDCEEVVEGLVGDS